jgi:phage terminase small subunit
MELTGTTLQTSAKGCVANSVGAGVRRPPASLSERGKEIWRETIDLIPGLVLPLDSAMVERFCDGREDLESTERRLKSTRGQAERRILQQIIDLCRHHIMACAEQLGLTPEWHLLVTRYLETPDGRAAHQELKKIFEGTREKPADGRPATAAN